MIQELIDKGFGLYSPPAYGDDIVFPVGFDLYHNRGSMTEEHYYFEVDKKRGFLWFRVYSRGHDAEMKDIDQQWMLDRLGLKNTIDNYSII